MANPFTPSFGVTPPLLVGRDDVIEDFTDSLEGGPGSPARALLVTGARGAGKTVMLNRLEDEARQRKWRVVSVTTRPGLVSELVESLLPAEIEDAGGATEVSRLTGISATALGFGFSFNRDVEGAGGKGRPSFQSQVFALADMADRQGAGLLISVDEVHRTAIEDLQVIVQTVQHAFREGRAVAFVAAGLPEAVSDLLNNEVLTFLRRAERYEMGSVSNDDVREALTVPMRNGGRFFAEDALAKAVAATRGYPYLIQTIGYESWRRAGDADEIGMEAVEVAVTSSLRRIGRLVHEASLAGLSEVDRSFLAAMSIDPGPSRTKDIAHRLGVPSNYATVYRSRLIAGGLIKQTGHGAIDFTIPYLREFLRDHVATQHIVAEDDTPPLL